MNKTNSKQRILIVDDHQIFYDAIQPEFESKGWICTCAEDSKDAIDKIKKAIRDNFPFDLVSVDLGLPPDPYGPEEGLKLVAELRQEDPLIEILVYTAQSGLNFSQILETLLPLRSSFIVFRRNYPRFSDIVKVALAGNVIISPIPARYLETLQVTTMSTEIMGSDIRKLSSNNLAKDHILRCFLSFRFSEPSISYAMKVKAFLEAQAIHVQTGQTYEPRGISSKMQDLLSMDFDFSILVVAEEGESFWTRDEVSQIRSFGKPVIPLVVAGSSFTSGIFGDLEWIEFPSGQISEVFIKLQQGIRYIRGASGK
jgi:CheY-like chemotaxis protein